MPSGRWVAGARWTARQLSGQCVLSDAEYNALHSVHNVVLSKANYCFGFWMQAKKVFPGKLMDEAVLCLLLCVLMGGRTSIGVVFISRCVTFLTYLLVK